MAIQSFFKHRAPRRFEHKPIYWDARKEELDKRVRRVRQELIAKGEIEPTEEDLAYQSQGEEERRLSHDHRLNIRGRFLAETEHLQRQVDHGIDSEVRHRRTVRLMIILLVLGFIFWYFFLR